MGVVELVITGNGSELELGLFRSPQRSGAYPITHTRVPSGLLIRSRRVFLRAVVECRLISSYRGRVVEYTLPAYGPSCLGYLVLLCAPTTLGWGEVMVLPGGGDQAYLEAVLECLFCAHGWGIVHG